jgi:hypothetical protein
VALAACLRHFSDRTKQETQKYANINLKKLVIRWISAELGLVKLRHAGGWPECRGSGL